MVGDDSHFAIGFFSVVKEMHFRCVMNDAVHRIRDLLSLPQLVIDGNVSSFGSQFPGIFICMYRNRRFTKRQIPSQLSFRERMNEERKESRGFE